MSHEVLLPRGPNAALLARTFVEQHLRPHLSDNAAGNVKMVLSELVGNAADEGDGHIVMRVELREDVLRIEVVAENETLHGWGLRIVELLASRWGARQGRAHVWADVPLR
jgi:hypothetical protein